MIRIRDVIYINVIIYLLLAAAIWNFYRPITAFILLFYYSAMVFAVYLYIKYYSEKLKDITFASPLVLASMVALFYVAANVFHGLLFISSFSFPFLLGNLPIGFLLGLSFGLSEQIGQRIVFKLNKVS